jgi:hypothetical protein
LLLKQPEINRRRVQIELTQIYLTIFTEIWIWAVVQIQCRRIVYTDLPSVHLGYSVASRIDISTRSNWSGLYEEGLISLWLYKENIKLRDWRKCIYSTYSPLSSTHLWFRCSNFFNPCKKNFFGCAVNKEIGIAKDLSAFPRTRAFWALNPLVVVCQWCQTLLYKTRSGE